MNFEAGLAYAQSLDAADELAPYRDRFVIDDPQLIYLDGNSLGRLLHSTVSANQTLVSDDWGKRLIRAWNEGWFTAPERIGGKIATLVGAQPHEVIMADSTSVNLFKLVAAALRARPGRTRVLTDNLNFPSDVYVLQGVIDLLDRGHQLEVIPSADSISGPVAAIEAALDEDVALLTLSHTVFKSGYVYDMTALTAAAHEAGALMLWDLSHSAGAVPVDLNGADADLAVGCTYKYLNGGPGSPAFLYMRRDLQSQLVNPIAGWMGQKQAFDFDLDYEPAAGLRRFLTGTPPILSLAAVESGVDIILEAGLDRLRAKSLKQTAYLIWLWERELEPLGFSLNTPRMPDRRGSHVSFGHDHGLPIDLALIQEMKVLPDFRAPDTIRFGVAPLYTTYAELYDSVQRLKRVVTERLYEKYLADGPTVT
jgi:kynureninase